MIQDVIDHFNDNHNRKLELRTSKHRSEITEAGTLIFGVDGNENLLQLMINHHFIRNSIKDFPGSCGQIVLWKDGTPKEDGKYLAVMDPRSKVVQEVHYTKGRGFSKHYSNNIHDSYVVVPYKWTEYPRFS